MPLHRQVTTCLKSGGPLSSFCTCHHCTLSTCGVCGAYEGSLTTDCPGNQVDFDRQQEVYETNLDFTNERGWHQGESMKRRVPQFKKTAEPASPQRSADAQDAATPMTNWVTIHRILDLQHELTRRAIAWVLADRTCEDAIAVVTRLKTEAADHVRKHFEPDERTQELLAKLEKADLEFQHLDRESVARDEEFRQTARQIVAILESAGHSGQGEGK